MKKQSLMGLIKSKWYIALPVVLVIAIAILLAVGLKSCGDDPKPTEPDVTVNTEPSEDSTEPSEDPTEPSEDPTEPSEDPTEPPATEPPATEPPATEPPATEPPATEPPATEPPATEPPATEPPATEPPATEPPATEPEPFDWKAALEAGGSYTLTEDITLGGVNIAKGIVSSLNLNGHTLTVTDEWLVFGSLTLNNGDIIIEKPEDEEAVYMESGISVGDEKNAIGTLKLDSVNIIGRRLWNIENNGTLHLTDSKYIVEGGYGVSNTGTATIKDCTLIADGEATTQIYNAGGTMNVIASELVEGSNFVSYYYMGAIESHAGTVTLDTTKITTGADQNSVFAAGSGNVVINSGTINTKVVCIPGATITIKGGKINGIAYKDITADSEIFIGAGCKLIKGENCWIICEPEFFDLKSALEAGGNYSLTENVTLGGVNIAEGVVSSLDLKGHTLTVTDEWEVFGSLTVTNGDIIIEKPEDEEAVYMESGLCVEAGTLKLEDVDIIGKRLWNIENNGTLYLTNAKYTVNGGYGISNSGTAVVNSCVLVANGEATTQIYNAGGTMNVIASELVEGSNFVSYYYMGAIESHAGTVTLDTTKITTGADQNSVFAAGSGNVIINSGTINTKVVCIPGATITIKGGKINGIAYKDITADSEIFIGAGSKLTKGENCWIIGE